MENSPKFRIGWPGFKTLDRYILRKFLGTYFFAIAMIIVVVVVFDYVEKVDDFTELKAPLKAVIFDYYLNFIPFFTQLSSATCSPSSPASSSPRSSPIRPRSRPCSRAA